MIVSDVRCAKLVSDALGMGFCPPYTCMGIERGGEVVGAVLFNHFEGADVHVTVAGHGWTKAFLRAVGRYVFETLGCVRMTAVTGSDEIARFAERLGGQREGLLRSHFGVGRDGIICGILASEWKFR